VAAFPGASTNAIYLEAQSNRRPFFIIPWNGNYLIGTTDVRFEEDPDQVRSESWEIDYLLAETNRAFPSARLTRDQILFTYSGVRPLPWTRNEDEQSITRRHFIREHPRLKNLLSIVGGKLTTYRSLAEECVDLVFRKLGKPSPACLTAREVLSSTPPREFTEAVVFSFEHELAKTLADVFLRRTMRGLSADLGLGDLEAAAETGVRCLGWSDERAKREMENYCIKLLTLNSESRANRF
jgi:glycerol-3-phosphate dehydrogenase